MFLHREPARVTRCLPTEPGSGIDWPGRHRRHGPAADTATEAFAGGQPPAGRPSPRTDAARRFGSPHKGRLIKDGGKLAAHDLDVSPRNTRDLAAHVDVDASPVEALERDDLGPGAGI